MSAYIVENYSEMPAQYRKLVSPNLRFGREGMREHCRRSSFRSYRGEAEAVSVDLGKMFFHDHLRLNRTIAIAGYSSRRPIPLPNDVIIKCETVYWPTKSRRGYPVARKSFCFLRNIYFRDH